MHRGHYNLIQIRIYTYYVHYVHKYSVRKHFLGYYWQKYFIKIV